MLAALTWLLQRSNTDCRRDRWTLDTSPNNTNTTSGRRRRLRWRTPKTSCWWGHLLPRQRRSATHSGIHLTMTGYDQPPWRQTMMMTSTYVCCGFSSYSSLHSSIPAPHIATTHRLVPKIYRFQSAKTLILVISLYHIFQRISFVWHTLYITDARLLLPVSSNPVSLLLSLWLNQSFYERSLRIHVE